MEVAAERATHLPRGVLRAAGVHVPVEIARRTSRSAISDGVGYLGLAGASAAFAALRHDDWASQELGVGVHRVQTWYADGADGDRLEASERVLRLVLDAASAAGGGLVVLLASSDDQVGLAAAQAARFEVLDVEAVHLSDAELFASGGPDTVGADGIETTLHGAHDLPAWSDVDRERFLAHAGAAARSHLTVDRAIDPTASARFYRSWTSNVLDGRWGDRLVVAWAEGCPIGLFSWVADRHAPVVGGLLHQSWALVTAEGRGALRSMTRRIVSGAATGARWTECETSVANVAMNRALAGTRSVSAVDRVVVLHAWVSG